MRDTGWNAFAVLSPIEGVLAAVVVWLLVDALRSGRVPTSVGAGALLVIGASGTVSALGLAVFSADWSPTATPYVFVVLAWLGADERGRRRLLPHRSAHGQTR